MILRKEEDTHKYERGSSRSHYVGSSIWRRLFLFSYRIGSQPVLHQQVYHGIFTEVSEDLKSFTYVIQAVCYYEIVSGFVCIKLALEVCGRYF
jgi:hypothetical protein